MEQETELQELSGTIQAVLFTNEENGYSVLRVRDGEDSVQTVVGCFPHAAPGETVLVSGTWVNHQVHGRQFKAEFSQRLLPTAPQAIFDYLAGGAVKGIGPATAALIVNTFGAKALDILENDPEKLAEIKGISKARALEFAETYRRQTTMRRLMDFVCSFSIRPILALKIYKFYGENSMDILHTDPYILAAPHIGGTFAEADGMALELGFEEDSTERVRAAALFELEHNLNNGHCFIPQPSLVEATCRLIGVENESAERCIDALVEEGSIVREEINGITACYLPALYEAESYVARRLVRMSRQKPRLSCDVSDVIGEIEQENGIHYAPAQVDSIRLALNSQLMVLTGGPGTGKTTTVRAILDVFDRIGVKTLLTAPTGRAAKRLTELSGREASTVHRLLGAKYADDGETVVFSFHENEPLRCNAVVLDESSMVDLLLLNALLKAIPEDARLILVGDVDQLPPVGPGNVFRGILSSGVFPAVRLTEIFRQADNSLIVRNAHRINKGEYPDMNSNTADFFRLRRLEAASAVETITELCSVRLPSRMHIPPEEIQVLSPTRRGEMGTIHLNQELQKALNPAAEDKAEKLFGEVIFRTGDRVMQIRNNYDILWHDSSYTSSGNGIYNGDIGYITKIDIPNEVLEIDFEGKITTYSFANLNELEHAWAVTVHKSQGCEFKAVIFALSASSKMLLTRSILYTGVTRAKELLILVGDENTVRTMTDNEKQSARFTFLKFRLLQLAAGV